MLVTFLPVQLGPAERSRGQQATLALIVNSGVILDLRFTLSFLGQWGLDRTTQLALLPKLASPSLQLNNSTHHCRPTKDPQEPRSHNTHTQAKPLTSHPVRSLFP